MSNGAILNSYDLYKFTSTDSQAKLRKITSYVVDTL